MEEWRDIEGWEGFYQVSSGGRVRSVDRVVVTRRHGPTKFAGRILRPGRGAGYDLYTLVHTTIGRREQRYAHDLVLRAFVGPKPMNMEVCHGPLGPHVNALENLRYDTRSENGRDRFKFGAGFGAWGGPKKKTPVYIPCAVCGTPKIENRYSVRRRQVCKNPACLAEVCRQTALRWRARQRQEHAGAAAASRP